MSLSNLFLVLDIGGTTSRIGVFDSDNKQLFDVNRHNTPNFIMYPKYSIRELQTRLIDFITKEILDYLRRYNIGRIGISFAGPIDEKGVVKSAPTILGSGIEEFNLAEILENRIGRRVVVLNDISGAVWRYTKKYGDTFCIITISSGVGNKVLYKKNILINKNGGGGEIGHHTFHLSADMPVCNCGGKGHVGSISSGRGTLELTKKMALLYPEKFRNSALYNYISHMDEMTTYHFVEAIHAHDEFAMFVLQESIKPIVSVISCIYHAIGVEKYIIIGGFATVIGDLYIDLLKNALKMQGCFGFHDFDSMIYMGEKDDDHSLIGMGVYLSEEIAE